MIENRRWDGAGQPIMHRNTHLILTKVGDGENPRGGVRGLIPENKNFRIWLLAV